LGILLHEPGEFSPVDVERLPVDDGAGGIGDGERRTILLNGRLAGSHAGTCGVSVYAGGKASGKGYNDRFQREFATWSHRIARKILLVFFVRGIIPLANGIEA
jgi:hypothetical protein